MKENVIHVYLTLGIDCNKAFYKILWCRLFLQALNRICLILDLDGYRIKSGFVTREMGWCEPGGNARSLHFKSSYKYDQLSPRDKCQVDYVYKNIHALPFDAHPREYPNPERLVPQLVRRIYSLNRKPHQNIVAYKGGNLEKSLLKKLKIPSVNLEWYGCLHADQLPDMGFDPGMSCGCHDREIGHCPRQETYMFHQWMTQYL